MIPRKGDIIKWRLTLYESKNTPLRINKVIKIETLDKLNQRFLTTTHKTWLDDGTWIRDMDVYEIINDNTENEAKVEELLHQMKMLHEHFKSQVDKVRDTERRLLFQKFDN